jgi:hypothetical protein
MDLDQLCQIHGFESFDLIFTSRKRLKSASLVWRLAKHPAGCVEKRLGGEGPQVNANSLPRRVLFDAAVLVSAAYISIILQAPVRNKGVVHR